MNNEEKILELLAELKTSVDKRLDTIEKHLDEIDQRSIRTETLLAEVDQRSARTETLLAEIDQRSIRTQVLLETDYHDKLQLLYDGHTAIMEKLDSLTPKTRVEALEDTVDMLKDVIRLMRQDIAELKKAQ